MPTSTRMKRALLIAAVAAALLGVGRADAYQFEGGRWPTRTVTYYTETPAYSWSVDTAAYAWNTSGARIQFVKSTRSAAKVVIGARWYKQPAGEAHVQRIGTTFIGATIGIQPGHDRYETALIMAHELGHVLGLDHESQQCATMNPTVGGDHTTLCPAPPPGLWTCRLLQPDDVRGAVALYGGTVRPWRGSPFCAR